MKVKTITCHNVYNYGAILQEFALLKYLELRGYDVETINYQPAYLADNYKLWKVVNSKWNRNLFLKFIYLLLKLPSRINNLRRYKKFDKFSEEYIKATTKFYKNNRELKKEIPVADAYICGSDQIWNTLFKNGKDPSFYLDFVPNDKLKISYAASFAVDNLDDNIKDFVKEKVSNLDFVSVREEQGVSILKDLGINKVTQVLDPVFLLDKNFWINQFVKEINESYIFVYDFDSNIELKSIAISLAKEKGLKIYTVNKRIRYADKNFWAESPQFFLSLIANADIVLTNSFHAVAFSIIFQKNFKVFKRKERINSRMFNLLKTLNLTDCFFDGNRSRESLINFSESNLILKHKIKESKDFLDKSLNNEIDR